MMDKKDKMVLICAINLAVISCLYIIVSNSVCKTWWNVWNMFVVGCWLSVVGVMYWLRKHKVEKIKRKVYMNE